MKILFTGGAGFIGSNVVDALVKDGHEVTVLDNLSTGKEENINPEVKFYNIDLLDIESLEFVFREFKPDVVNHHAAQIDVRKSVEDPAFDAETNIIGSINLFELSINAGVSRIIFSSTGGALYGELEKLPASEDTSIEPLSPYGVAKYCAENYLNYFKRLYGIERVILRYANVYGPRQDPLGEAGVVAIFTGKILKGEKPVIYGDGTQTRDYIYVEDVVKANVLALEGKEGIYNIGTGKETSVNELIEVFSKVLGREIKSEYAPPRKGEVHRISLGADMAKKELGFVPKYSLEEGLKKTIEWYTSLRHRKEGE
jgi:UDP-glucose 4-epimerase